MYRVIANLACVTEVNIVDLSGKKDFNLITKPIENITFYKDCLDIYKKGESVFGFDCRKTKDIYENVILEGILDVPLMILQSNGFDGEKDSYIKENNNIAISKNDIIYLAEFSAEDDVIVLTEIAKSEELFEKYDKNEFNSKNPFNIVKGIKYGEYRLFFKFSDSQKIITI